MRFSRVPLAVALSASLAAMSVSASAQEAQSQPAPASAPAETQSPNQAPLPPAGAAGALPAQGFDEVPWVFIAGGAIALAAAIWALTQQKNDSATSTNP